MISSSDRESFKRCRRAWDFGSRTRQNYEPVKPVHPVDFRKAIREALAVYYFPGMWQWNREIVRPLALDGFFSSVEEQRARCAQRGGFADYSEQEWDERVDGGARLLERYFDWAATVDRFSPIRVETEFEVNISDPENAGRDLMISEGVPIRYQGRVALLVMDDRDRYWIVEHRMADATWSDVDQLLLDERGVSFCWAWEHFFLGMRISGIIYNELRVAAPADSRVPPGVPAGAAPAWGGQAHPAGGARRAYSRSFGNTDEAIKQEGNEFFHRTYIPLSRNRLRNFRRQLAAEVLEMTAPELPVYPNPTIENCSDCAYRKPCIAANEGSGVSLILETEYRRREAEKPEAGRIGSTTWSVDRGAMPLWLKSEN